MRIFSTLIFTLFVTLLSAQNGSNYWTDVTPAQIFLPENAEMEAIPSNNRLMSLDFQALKNHLFTAPMEYTNAAKQNPVLVSLPLNDGSFEDFEIIETQTMEPALAAKFPNHKSFIGRSTNERSTRLRLNISPEGVTGSIYEGQNTVIISPYIVNENNYHAVYLSSDLLSENPMPSFSCGTEHSFNNEPALVNSQIQNPSVGFRDDVPVDLRTYEIAFSCTGEWANTKGGTVSSVMSAFNTMVNVLSEAFGGDMAIKFVLVDNVENLIYLDGANDPFHFLDASGTSNPNNQYFINQNINQDLLNTVIGVNNYDISQLFSNGGCYTYNSATMMATFVGGEAGGATCSNNKGRGLTCNNGTPTGIANTLAHEIGHSFGAGHTWNHCPGPLSTQWSSGTSVEPGSGSTILSYSGGCQASVNGVPQNINDNGINYYSAMSIQQIKAFAQGNAGSCGDVTTTSNNFPEPSHNYTDGFYIPISTPFRLDGTATDEDELDDLTYCWEQFDIGPNLPMESPSGTVPLFRSYPPVTTGRRYFPNLSLVVNNETDVRETLPFYSRPMTFRMTVRDNNTEAGGTDFVQVEFLATEAAGPFLVEYPNDENISMIGGEYKEITWDVANTDGGLVKCETVNIKMSTNGGFAYPHTLAINTQNDGSAFVFVPNVNTSSARIMVEAADNIFYDISNNNFAITPATEPGYTLQSSSEYEQICVPDIATFALSTTSLVDFEGDITLEVLSGLPTGVNPVFSQNPVPAGESTDLTLDFSDVTIAQDGEYQMLVQATSPDADTVLLNINFDVVFNDFQSLALMTPSNGTTGLSLLPSFEWADVQNADLYDIQIATSPLFDEASIIDEGFNLGIAEYTPSLGLQPETIYYWRVRPSNKCGQAPYSEPFAFSTFFATCDVFQSVDAPKNISAIGTPTVESILTVVDGGVISDVNVVNLKGNHDAILDLKVSLKSPAGTTQELFNNICGNTSIFNMNLDDEGAFAVGTNCPPVNGITYVPENPLSIFDEENTLGNWTLLVEVIDDFGNGGTLESWGLEFCASFEPNGPFLVKNVQAEVAPQTQVKIKNVLLLADDADNTAAELQYTITVAPDHGVLYLDGTAIGVGSTFTQQQINWKQLVYENETGDIGTIDDFSFLIEDGTGGWTGISTFDILITDDPINNTTAKDLDNAVSLFPNPAKDLLNVQFKNSINERITLSVFDIHGRLLTENAQDSGVGTIEMNTAALPTGVYFLAIKTEGAIFTKKFTIQK